MATTMRGRTGARTRSGGFGWGSATMGGTRSVGHKTGRFGAPHCPPQYKGVCTTFACKINSFKTLYSQTHGPAKFTRPSTAVLNNFANWINKGAIVQTCTSAQVSRWARTFNMNFSTRAATTTACKNVLGKKFGKSTIKAVARTKSGSFMVVTAPTNKGRTFSFPK